MKAAYSTPLAALGGTLLGHLSSLGQPPRTAPPDLREQLRCCRAHKTQTQMVTELGWELGDS